LLRFFALEIVKVLQTEAAVERSFRIEADTWTPYRNKRTSTIALKPYTCTLW
jgi:hypothetical protein